jgi:hypothetical protein
MLRRRRLDRKPSYIRDRPVTRGARSFGALAASLSLVGCAPATVAATFPHGLIGFRSSGSDTIGRIIRALVSNAVGTSAKENILMPSMHVFIDGSWLFKACGPERALSARTERINRRFDLDFSRLDRALLAYLGPTRCRELGDRYIATSIFSLPDDFESGQPIMNQ